MILVMAAMAGMLLTGNAIFMSMGIATMLVIAVAVIGSLTVLPAVLAAMGDKLEKGRLPFIGRRQAQARESRMWGWLTDRVMRHPIVAIVVAGGALLALSIPALGMQTKLPGIESYSKDFAGHTASDVTATSNGRDGYPASGQVAFGRYSVLIYSQGE